MELIKILIISRNNEDKNILFSSVAEQKDLQIIGVEEDEASTIIKSEKLKPNVLIMDLQSSEIDETKLAPIIRRKSPSTYIIIICNRDENDYAGIALRAGISGFLLKNTDMNKLIPVIKIVSLGGYYISASVTQRALDTALLVKQLPDQFDGNNMRALVFSSCERMIITNIALGLSDEEIARHFHFSTGTIRNYITEIKRKTKLKNRTQIAVYSLVYGHISFDSLWF